MKASNVPDFMFPPGDVEDVELGSTEPLRFSTANCSSSFMVGTRVGQRVAGGPSVCVVSANSFRLRPGTRLLVTGPFPLVILAKEQVEIGGTIDVSASAGNPGPGGFPGGVIGQRLNGLGLGGGVGGTQANTGARDASDGGGGGGGLCAAGGAGGRGGTEDVGLAPGGAGGQPFNASWELQPILGGSGGGRGQGRRSLSDVLFSPSAGGAGGGAIQISAGEEIRVTGSLLAGGGAGAGGLGVGGNPGSGGGGGSGGAILLEAPSVIVEGLVLAAGGGGGAGASGGVTGANGEDGRDAGDARALGGFARDEGGSGASGGGIPVLDGATGADAKNNGGGGGGSVGCLLIRSRDAELNLGAKTNPMSTPGLRVLEPLF